jgi:hypothetical protein
MPHGGRKGHRPGHATGIHKQRTQDMAPATTVPPPETLVQALVQHLRAGTAPAEVAAQVVEAAPAGTLAPLLDAVSSRVDEERFVALLAALMDQPLEVQVQEHIVALLERLQTSQTLETLVALGEQDSVKAVRRAARRALFRLRNAGVPLPEPEALTPQVDVASWPVAQAWANRIDQVGSQAVILARERPGRDLAYMSVVVSDDRGIVDGMGEAGVSANHVRRLAEKMGLPPGAPIYRVSPEYVRWRIRQGEETSRQAGRRVAPEYLTWRHLLDGIDDTWHPDLEALCRERARPDWLERTSVLMYALELTDWWPDPEGSEGRAVNRFVDDVAAVLDALPDGGHVEGPNVLSPPPYLEMLSETHYIAMMWPFNDEGSAAIEEAIDRHFDALFPARRLRRYRQALLHMGYLTGENAQPMLSQLLMTAAWGLDPVAGIPPREHPFVRQMLRKTVEVVLET